MVCGNTLVIKSSEECPRSQALVIKVFEEVSMTARFMRLRVDQLSIQAGLPKGVLNFVTISKEDSPARVADIIAHPEVRKVNVSANKQYEL